MIHSVIYDELRDKVGSMKKLLLILAACGLGGAALAQDAGLYVVDIGPNRQPPWQVIRYDADGGNPQVFINTQLNRPQDIIFLEHRGSAIVSNLLGNNITEYDAESGAFIRVWASGIGQPTRMEIGPGNLLYVVQWAGNGRVWRYDLDGNFVDEFTTVGVSNSIGMDWDAQGNLYVASFDQAHIRRFDPDGNDLGLFVSTNLQGPTNIAFEDDGNLLVLDWSGQSVKRFDASGNFLGVVVAAIGEPEGLVLLDNGEFLVGHGSASSVPRYGPNGAFIGNLVAPGSGGLAKPNAVRIRGRGFVVNAGLNDAWFNPDTPGQGFFFNVFPELNLVFIAWFTYDVERPPQDVQAILGEPGHRWITGIGPFDGDTVNISLELTQGGVFDSGDPPVQQSDAYGTMSITFHDCATATVEYSIPDGGVSGTIPIQRIVQDNVPLCQALQAQ